MLISSLAVSNFFVQKSLDTGVELNPMKVIKMVYIAHGWHLALKNNPLIDEAVEAWRYGPIVLRVYQEFRHFRDQQITQMYEKFERGYLYIPTVRDQETVYFLEKVWEAYCGLSGLQLSTITHKPDTPWHQTWNKYNKNKNIPNNIIKKYYRSLVQN
jgi:uncharacterized phage-associated protein